MTAMEQLIKPKLRELGDKLVGSSIAIQDGVVAQPATNHIRKPSFRGTDAFEYISCVTGL